ncbi:DNA integrity scanning diadenylate cyclase DisA [Clostridium sp. DL1XJH146]
MRDKKDEKLIEILKKLAPGTPLREGLDNILRAKTGGLIVVGDTEDILKVVDGGFKIDSEYSPSYIYELAKMDGAIIISSDIKKILCANTQIITDFTIPTYETGTRHRTAQRCAIQTGALVIAISQRRNIITIYDKSTKYVLRNSSVILARANQALQTLEKYVAVLDRAIVNLNLLEFQDLVTLFDIIAAIQRTEMVMRIVDEIERYISELGNEGRLISMQLIELVKSVEEDGIFLIRDYNKDNLDYKKIYSQIQNMSSDELVDKVVISKLMGHSGESLMDTIVSPRGYRMLSKIPRIPSAVIDNLVNEFNKLTTVMEASYEELDRVDGIGEARAKAIKNGLRNLREQIIIDKQY